MDPVLWLILGGLAGVAVGIALGWLVGRSERAVLAERLAGADEVRRQLSESFQALSAEALKSNNRAFLDLAQTAFQGLQQAAQADLDRRRDSIEALVAPVRESLSRMGEEIRQLEKSRESAYSGLTTQVRQLLELERDLREETAQLRNALRSPAARGRWGEVQLRRVVELAGMLEHCDFSEQVSAATPDGLLRPDLVVHLPNGRQVVVDAKVSLKAYLTAHETAEEAERRTLLVEHARQVREHVRRLAAKRYWSQFDPTPEFVVAFLPGEVFFSAALREDPELVEYGMEQQVILATPTTLIALLKAVAHGWREQRLAENALEIRRAGAELHERLVRFCEHLAGLRRHLERAVESYNQAAASLESRVLPAARRFPELGVPAAGTLPPVEPLSAAPRVLSAGEDR